MPRRIEILIGDGQIQRHARHGNLAAWQVRRAPGEGAGVRRSGDDFPRSTHTNIQSGRAMTIPYTRYRSTSGNARSGGPMLRTGRFVWCWFALSNCSAADASTS